MNDFPGLDVWRAAAGRVIVPMPLLTDVPMTPAALIFVVCRALADQGPLDVNGFPVDGIKLDFGTCRNEVVQIYDQTEGQSAKQNPDLSHPNICSRMSMMMETAHWEKDHPGWYVRLVKCPHPDGTFPGDTDV